MKNRHIILVFFVLVSNICIAQQNVRDINSPLAVDKLIADRLIRTTPFKYKLSVAVNNGTFNGMQCIDFGRSFMLAKPAVAYAFTHIDAATDTDTELQLEHNDGCKIWLNGKLIYEKKGDRKIALVYDERSVEMSNRCALHLKKGINTLLIKSETKGDEWRVNLQLPSAKGSVDQLFSYPKIGLSSVQNIDPSVAKLTNWLVIGPFKNPAICKKRGGLDMVYLPEKELIFGKMYKGAASPVTWTIPKIEVLGNMIDPLEWGTSYNWNYHNGGVAWAMEQLSELSGDKKYDDYATNFCNFHLNGIPFVTYQVKTLNADSSANNQIINTNLLDFTLAPSLPLIYKLLKNKQFSNRDEYKVFVDRMLKYARNGQLRLPGLNIYTRTTPQKYTTWADDMFMGIPFLVQASQYADDTKTRDFFLEDAASQVIAFSSQVWDADAQLYMHAHFSGASQKFPHWSRANGWAIWAMSEVLMNLPKSSPKYGLILNQYRTLVTSLVKYQTPDGFWLNVLDRPDSKSEVSGTAIFTMGIARGVTNGWLDEQTFKPIVMRGWSALKTQIAPDGTVHNICMGTMCSPNVNYYLNRPFYDNDTHGIFAVLFAGIEVDKMMKKSMISEANTHIDK